MADLGRLQTMMKPRHHLGPGLWILESQSNVRQKDSKSFGRGRL